MKIAKIVEELVKIKIEVERNKNFSAIVKIDSLLNTLCNVGETKNTKLVSRPHNSNCMLELDSEYYGPCTCYKYDKNDASDFDL